MSDFRSHARQQQRIFVPAHTNIGKEGDSWRIFACAVRFFETPPGQGRGGEGGSIPYASCATTNGRFVVAIVWGGGKIKSSNVWLCEISLQEEASFAHFGCL